MTQMFSFLNKLKSHQRVEDKYERIIDKGLVNADKHKNTTEFGEIYDQNGAIKVENYVNQATNYLATNVFDLEAKQCVERYRYMSTLPEVDDAIEEIVNEALVMDPNANHVVNIDYVDDELSDILKDIITKEFEYIRDTLLNFDIDGHRYFKRWYVDGKIYIEKVIDPDYVRDGILKVNMLDAYYITHYNVFGKEDNNGKTVFNYGSQDSFLKNKLVDEFFIVRKPNYMSSYYSTNGMWSMPNQNYSNNMFSLRVEPPLMVYVDSGLHHPTKFYAYSYLHKALKVSNQLSLLEDALLIYRITRAPERRIFYIEVGNMPPNKAEQYIQTLMRQYRQEKVYDAGTGSITEKNNYMAMTQDFWLPRRNGAATTEVGSLQGGQNLSEVEDLNYFARKIWRALGVPYSRRADKENNGVSFNSGRELTLEELKFHKFIMKLRQQFSKIFEDLLETQLIMKRIVNEEEIETVLSKIKYVYHNDNYFSDFLKLDVLQSKLDVINNVDPHVGKYFDDMFVMKEIMGWNDEKIKEMKKRIEIYKQNAGQDNTESGDMSGLGGGGMPSMGGDMGGLGGDMSGGEEMPPMGEELPPESNEQTPPPPELPPNQ
jgi:hypothetical protein